MIAAHEPFIPLRLSDDNDDIIYIRYTPNESGRESASLHLHDLSALLSKIKGFCSGLKSALLAGTPDKISVKFGVEVTTDDKTIIPLIVPVSGKGVIEITLEWEPKK